MSKRTSIYKFLYLESGDIIYPAYDKANMSTAENQIFGMYDYLGQGVIEGWQIYWMGCTSNPYVMQQRQALIEAYNSDPFSYLALEYESLGRPAADDTDAWNQCIVVTPGLGIVDVFHAATENPSFFRFDRADHYYVWAEKNSCTNTEYLCEITAPEYPDEDYDLYNKAIYLGEVFTNTVLGNVTVTQIIYSDRRRELKNSQGDLQRLLKQALINHVHSGEGDMPSKVDLSSRYIATVTIIENSNTFSFTPPSDLSKYADPYVLLNGVRLDTSQYQITGNYVYLQNSLDSSAALQIIYELAPGVSCFIALTTNAPAAENTLSLNIPYFITDGSTKTNQDNSQTYIVFKWNSGVYSDILVYLQDTLLDSQVYILDNINGTITLVGTILPSIVNFKTSDITLRFVEPSVQVSGLLSNERIRSVSGEAITSGTIPPFRLTSLDHLGFFRLNEPASLRPYKKLLDSGDHISFYPTIDSYIQYSDYVIFGQKTIFVKADSAETSTPPRTALSTPNGLFITQSYPQDFSNIEKISWNTDTGLADDFAENYFGNFSTYAIPGTNTNNLNPKFFWVLSKSKNQFKNVLYVSLDFGSHFRKITLPLNSSNEIVTINDYISTVEVYQYTTGEVILTPHLGIRYLYYLACDDGIYTATLTSSQNPTKPIWLDPSYLTTNYSTGSVNQIAEAVNVGVTITSHDSGLTEKDYENYRNLYASCENGFFVFNNGVGEKFAVSASNNTYNQDNSEFNFVYWIGQEDSSNSPSGVVWGDYYACYLSNSAQKVTTTTQSATSTTTQTIYYEALTNSYNNIINVLCASGDNIDLTNVISIIDGVSLTSDASVLLKNQDDPSENGLYIWSSVTQKLYPSSTSNLRVYVQNGSQAGTEWIELQNPGETSRLFALYYYNLFTMNSGEYTTSVCKDNSSGPGSNSSTVSYLNSFFVATNQRIFRVLCYSDLSVIPAIETIVWDTDKYGLITGIQHYSNSNDLENGLLVVFTTNGIFKSSQFKFNTLAYERYIRTITPQQAFRASVYDAYTLNEYIGKVTSVGIATNTTSIADGTYLNQKVYTNTNSGFGLSLDLNISNGLINSYGINSPGFNYLDDLTVGHVAINNTVIPLNSIVTEGLFVADSDSQAFVFSKAEGLNPSNLYYEVDYVDFYIKPWSGDPLILNKINNTITTQSKSFSADASAGLIRFSSSLNKSQKNLVTVTLTNRGQYISNVGETPHEEVFNIVAADSNAAAKLTSTYDPLTAKDYLLPLDRFDNTLWSADTNVVKISGYRASTSSSNIQVSYSEIISVTVNMTTKKVYIVAPLPSSQPLTQGSSVFVGRVVDNLLGIEDYISLKQSNLTYHLNSVSHENVYTLYNTIYTKDSTIFDFPTLTDEQLSGVDRGLKNTLFFKNFSDFDPSATFIGYSFGVEPSVDDIAAAPNFINLILNFQYGENPTFATDKGIWVYNRNNSTWQRRDTVDNSLLIYYADSVYVDSLGNQNTYAGTDLGLFTIDSNNMYSINELFEEPVLCMNANSWYTSSQGVVKRFEAYGKENGAVFILRTTQNNETTLASDFFEGHKVYDIYYNTFYRYDENNNRTEHPAIYLATEYSVWVYTTDSMENSEALVSPHTLLYGREIFGQNIITNPSVINPTLPGLPSKIFKIISIPSGGKNTWLVVCSSNGVYVIINWKQCDPANPEGLTFYPQNNFSANGSKGRACYCIVSKTNDPLNSTYFVGTDKGVYKSTNKCFNWTKTSKFDGQDLSIDDIKYFTDTSNNGYIIAATNIGLWISDNDGDSWVDIKDYSDPEISIDTSATYGSLLSQSPQQVFNTIATGSVSKAFIYLNPQNLSGTTYLSAYVSNGIGSTQSATVLGLSNTSFAGMYGFTFDNCNIIGGANYSLGIVTDNATYAQQVTWGLSSLDDPYDSGYAKTSGGIQSDKDFYFRIDVNSNIGPVETIEPVGFYNTSYAIGFASGNFLGASISSSGSLYSNVGLLINIVLDISKSFEITDTSIITENGISTSYLRQAVVDTVVPANAETTNIYTRLKNQYGISKLLVSMYGYNNNINDLLLYYSSNVSSDSNCFNFASTIYDGYTNDPTVIQSALAYVNNSGRASKLYDAVLFNSRLQYPQVINGFYSSNLDLIDTDFVNIYVVSEQYKNNPENFVSLNLTQITGDSYQITYANNVSPFIWNSETYTYILVVYSNGSSNTSSYLVNTIGYVNNETGIFDNSEYSPLVPVTMYLSNDWNFDTTTNDLSHSYAIWKTSYEATQLVLNLYAKSFKPLILLTTDGNDTSQATAVGVNSSLLSAWMGLKTQMLVIEPNSSGNENKLREMIPNTNSSVFKYSSYPFSELQSILITDDILELYTSYWTRKYDFNEPKFISYIFTSYTTPGESEARVMFSWSKDRINFSDYTLLPNNIRYNLNQKVTSIYYKIEFTEDYNGTRILPHVDTLYHVVVTPSTQVYMSYPQATSGQVFETLAMASMTNNNLSEITPLVGRTQSIDLSYFEQVQLGRQSALPNRQLAYQATEAYTLTGLLLFPAPDANGNTNYKIFYIVDVNSTIYTWTNDDLFTLYASTGAPVLPGGYTLDPENGKIAFQNPLDSQIGNLLQYQTYTVTIQYTEKLNTVIGEPTTTIDYKSYFLRNGRIPTDATVVVFVNQQVYKGDYVVDYYDGVIVFATVRESSDNVTVLIKFADYFRAGLQIESYSNDNIALQSFNFTHTSLDDLKQYYDSFNYSRPYLIGSPILTPVAPNINDKLSVGYAYSDDYSASETGTLIYWWRYRSGIEYVTYNPSALISVTGGTLPGISTFNIKSYYNQNATPYVLSMTITSAGLTTTVSSVDILDRGLNFIGTSSVIANSIVLNNGITLSNLNGIVTAYTLTPSYQPGYATSDYFVRINPTSNIGYSTVASGWAYTATITSLPDYDGKISEPASDIGSRSLFDYRDEVFVTIKPYNGYTYGNTYKTNTITISGNYTPSISTVNIVPFTALSTSYSISYSVDHTANYYYNFGNDSAYRLQNSSSPSANNRSDISWYKVTSVGPKLLSKFGTLSSTLITLNDQVFCVLLPGVYNSDSTVGYGNTVLSDVYNVTS